MSVPAPQQPGSLDSRGDVGTQALTQALRGGFFILNGVIIALIAYFFVSNWFRVEPGKSAVVLRFGRPMQTSKDALLKEGRIHFAWPYPIDEKVVVTGGEQAVVSTVGWYTPSSSPTVQFDEVNDGYILCAGGGMLHIKSRVEYTISDPIRYNFHFQNVDSVLRCVIDNALTTVGARFTSEGIRDKQRGEFLSAVEKQVKELTQQYKLGVEISRVRLDPPPALPRGEMQQEQNKLLQALQGQSTRETAARSKSQTLRLHAETEAIRIQSDAKVQGTNIKSRVQMEAKEFNDLMRNYGNNPVLLRAELERRLVESLRGLLASENVQLYVLPSQGGMRPAVNMQIGAPATKAPVGRMMAPPPRPFGANPGDNL
ncbi:MAG: hypothetical protein EXS22_02480 [Pedosphaera sp.]|nr:hypothetical protein [Pedosphaera sp.]MSU42891.1 hypothetical protein [Pedosphaera sp.]